MLHEIGNRSYWDYDTFVSWQKMDSLPPVTPEFTYQGDTLDVIVEILDYCNNYLERKS